MNEKKFNLIPTIIISLALLSTVGCYDPSKDQETRYPTGISSYNDIRPYTFDPNMILMALDQSREGIFQPLPDWGGENIFPPGSFGWQQKDYLRIANALNQVANHDNLEGWSLYSINFSRDCADDPIGFDDSRITYFKTNGERYITRQMDLYPLKKEANWAGNRDYPRPFFLGWKIVDLEKLNVTADDALQMAEANGGKTARQAVKNACSIFIGLSPNTGYDDWKIEYDDYDTTFFEMTINPYNSLYKIITP